MCGVRPKKCVFFCVAFQLRLAKRCFWAHYCTTWSGLRLASYFSAVWHVGVFLVLDVGRCGGVTNTLALQLVDTIIYRYDYIPKPCLVIV